MEWLVPILISALALIGALCYLFGGKTATPKKTPVVAPPADSKPAAANNAKAPATPKTIRKTVTRGLGDVCEMRVLWASQTGTAESFAQTLVDEALKHNVNALSMDIDLYDPTQMAKDTALLCFVVATYGEGEPTDNAKFFVESVTAASAGSCEAVRYTVFGLGNKTYQQFNAMGRFFDRRMGELGAKRVADRGEGDDDANLEEDFKSWRKRTWPVLVAALKGTAAPAPSVAADGAEEPDEPVTFQPRFRLEECPDTAAQQERFEWRENQSGPFDAKRPFVSRVVATRELHTGGDRSCRHVELALGPGQSYEPGDHLAIYPPNPPALVNRLLQRLAVPDPAQVIRLVGIRDSNTLHLGPVSIRNALTYFLDITAPPRKQILVALAAHADKAQAEALLALAAKDGHEAYMREIKTPSTTLEELLSDFPSCRPPLDLVLQLLPRLPPRYYSISSAPQAQPGRVSITVAVLKYTNSKSRQHEGICTTWLASLPVGAPVPLFVRASSFRLPKEPSTPVVMVGPGTGLAPFRGFIQARAQANVSGAKTVLFFGCRHREHDYLYREELEQHVANGHLTLFTAFSREHSAKCYVQHRIAEAAGNIAQLLKSGAWLYVCGDARRMPADVREALAAALVKEGGLSPADAEAHLERMHKEGRYQLDVWF